MLLTQVHVEVDDPVHTVPVDVHLVPRPAHVQTHILHTAHIHSAHTLQSAKIIAVEAFW